MWYTCWRNPYLQNLSPFICGQSFICLECPLHFSWWLNISLQGITPFCWRPSSVVQWGKKKWGKESRHASCYHIQGMSVSVRIQEASSTNTLYLTHPQYLSRLTCWEGTERLPELLCICWSLCNMGLWHSAYPAVHIIMTWGFYYLLFIPLLPSGSSGSAYSISFPS